MESNTVSISSIIEVLLKLKIVVNSNKYAAQVVLLGPGKVVIREFFKDDEGHLDTLPHEDTDVNFKVFEELCTNGFISGDLESGHVSDSAFVISDKGRNRFLEYLSEIKYAKI